ncbi:MAG: response regulator transcription factor [Austwickia sp.]|nr:response regulator transcription factor [Actinomycetota bacterium]MCO5308961.1 response regulator transcription factor [Austwickia sp.]
MRVLVVEDDPSLGTMLRKSLTREGFSVEVVGNGPDGLFEAGEHAYDVVVLDIMLPGLNGYKVVEAMRARGNWTPVLMLTAKDGPYDQVDAFDLGADDYLTKPFDLVVLVARLRALIRRGAPERPAILTVGELTLDPAEHRVARAGTEISLTAREFSLLEYLMRHAGRVLTKPQILEGVWDPAFEGEPNVVEVYVGYLRRKIDAPFGTTSIETIRGVGYRMVAT